MAVKNGATVRVRAALSLAAVLAACSDEVTAVEEPTETVDYDGLTEARGVDVAVTAGRSAQAQVQTDGGLTTVTVQCALPTNPDSVGLVFRLTAPDLGVANANSQPPRAGYFSWTGMLAAGAHAVSLTGVSGSGACRVTWGAATGMCGRGMFRSPNVNHTHVRVGVDSSPDWEPFPTSGSHWGAWPAWNHVYTRAVLRGFMLHGLEHGGLVLSYRCGAAEDSPACADQAAQLVALAQRFGNRRVFVTPDPTQPSTFAVRGWRWAYTADCLDADAVLPFMRGRYRRGREDVDADPPLPFDPTTTNVPCQNLAAAPDSC